MNKPTDAEIDELWRFEASKNWNSTLAMRTSFTRAVLARWGQPDGEHTNAELQQMLVECYEGKKKCYFAIGQHQTAIDNLIKERDALIKSANSGEPVARLEIGKTKGGASLTHIAEPAAFQLPEGMYALYTAPQPTQPQAGAVPPAGREPLTDLEIESATGAKIGTPLFLVAKGIVQATESAHEITGGQHGADT